MAVQFGSIGEGVSASSAFTLQATDRVLLIGRCRRTSPSVPIRRHPYAFPRSAASLEPH